MASRPVGRGKWKAEQKRRAEWLQASEFLSGASASLPGSAKLRKLRPVVVLLALAAGIVLLVTGIGRGVGWGVSGSARRLPCAVVSSDSLRAVSERDAEEQADSLEATVLDYTLLKAEQQYKTNFLARQASLDKIPQLKSADLASLYLVPLYPCGLPARFGKWGHPGLWLCLSHRNVSRRPTVVIVGGTPSASLEQDLSKRLHAFSHTFDFTLSPKDQAGIERFHSAVKFHNAGLAGSADIPEIRKKLGKDALVVDLPKLLKMVGGKSVDVLYLGCTGCEVGVVADMARMYTSESAPFGQLVVDWSNAYQSGPKKLQKFMSEVEGLGYRLFYSEVDRRKVNITQLSFIHQRLVIGLT